MTAARAIAFSAFAALLIAGLTGPAGSSVTGNGKCGPAIDVLDPGLRASFARFDDTQSAPAAKVCALYRNADLGR
jgi:hypothetical protein